MAKANREKASDAWVNPPTPQDPTSDVTRNFDGSSGEPLHKPPMLDDDGNPIEGDNLPTEEELEERRQAKSDAKAEARANEDRSREDVEASYRQAYDGSTGPAAVTSPTGRDANTDGRGGSADQGADRWADDPMPEDAQGRLEWAQRGTDTADRIDAALRAEEARGNRKRSTLINGLQALRAEHQRNESNG